MGVFDKIKNALFEVEYVEVDEPPKKEKKVKKKDKEEQIEEEKPIAKRIVLPGKREEKIEELKEEELLDEDFEIRPKEEEKPREQFKFMDDNDFKVEDEPEFLKEEVEEPQIIEERPLYGETREERHEEVYTPITTYNNPNYKSSSETNLYGMSSHDYNVPVHQYGTYEKTEKTYFKPSPIISPIYGILDKNYRKEDVKEKKEIRLTGYTRSNMNVDDIREKAYGKEEKTEPEVEENIFEVENDASDNVMVDLSDRSKPEVKELTMGDAEEYFEDLGLEYNVDYVDVSTDRSKIKKEEPKEEIVEENPIDLEEVIEEEPIEETPVEDVKIEQEKETEPDDDNLFDLIDSMYEEN